MNNHEIELELLNHNNFEALLKMTMEFWPETNYIDEYEFWKTLINNEDQYCVLVKNKNDYIGFLHIGIRSDYVEGSDSSSTPYLEAIYIKPTYRRNKIASIVLQKGEDWLRLKGYKYLASDTELENLISQEFHLKLNFKEVKKVVSYIKKIDN